MMDEKVTKKLNSTECLSNFSSLLPTWESSQDQILIRQV